MSDSKANAERGHHRRAGRTRRHRQRRAAEPLAVPLRGRPADAAVDRAPGRSLRAGQAIRLGRHVPGAGTDVTTLREAVERAARALGMWREGPADQALIKSEWTIEIDENAAGRYVVRRWRHAQNVPGAVNNYAERWSVDDLKAALVLLCHALPETRERCPDCEGDGLQHWGRDEAKPKPAPWKTWEGWKPGGGPQYCAHRPCPTCPPGKKQARGHTCGTGWVPRSWGAVLLGAMPRPCATCESWGDVRESTCPECEGTSKADRPGNTDDREQATVLADDLLGTRDPPCSDCERRDWKWEQVASHRVVKRFHRGANEALREITAAIEAAGARARIESEDMDGWFVAAEIPCPACTVNGKPTGIDRTTGHARRQLGEWLALWLDAVPCSPCASEGDPPVRWQGRDGRDIDCPSCRGSGLELGAHTQAITEALGMIAKNASR